MCWTTEKEFIALISISKVNFETIGNPTLTQQKINTRYNRSSKIHESFIQWWWCCWTDLHARLDHTNMMSSDDDLRWWSRSSPTGLTKRRFSLSRCATWDWSVVTWCSRSLWQIIIPLARLRKAAGMIAGIPNCTRKHNLSHQNRELLQGQW